MLPAKHILTCGRPYCGLLMTFLLMACYPHGVHTGSFCMEDTKAFTLRRSGKPTFFYCHRCFLGKSHAFRKNTTKFRKGLMDLDPPSPRRNGEDIWRRVRDYPKIVDLHNVTGDKPEGYGVTHNWDRRSIF